MTTTLKLDLPGFNQIQLRADSDRNAQAVAAVDARRAVAEAMAAPVGFPPLAQATVPDDRVAVALDGGIPDIVAVAAGLLDALHAAGVEGGRVSLVAASGEDATLLEAARGKEFSEEVGIVRHDPGNEDELCWAGITRGDKLEVKVNRVLFEADLCIPVTCLRPPRDRENRGAYSGLYPAFGDKEVQKLYLKSAGEEHQSWCEWTEEVGWIVGAPLVVLVTPGAKGSVSAVTAGASSEAFTAAQHSANEAWRRAPGDGAELVVATLTGEPERQTWDDIARALSAADQVASPGGAVALCTGLRRPIGKSLGRLRQEGDVEDAARKLTRDASVDTWAAAEIANALMRGPLFLVSRLDEDLVEELGMASIQGGEQLQRLADRFGSIALLEDAHRVHFEQNGGDA